MRSTASNLALLAIVAAGSFAALAEDAPKTTGWRTDGTGAYPGAAPLTQWAADKGVVWSTEMPGRSNSLPVLVGEKIFIGCDPCSIYCINAADGKPLWNASLDYKDLLSAEDWAKAEAEIASAKEINKQLSPLTSEITQLNKQLKTAENKAEVEAKLEPLKKQAYDLQTKLKDLKLAAQYEMPRTHGSNTYTTPTPVTDGKHVWIILGNGIVGCFDLEGKRVWAKFVARPPNTGWGHSSSPALAGDKLIVHIDDLVAFDAATGEEKWRQKIKYSWGTPVAAKVGGEDIVITPRGDFVRAADGKVVANAKVALEYNTPVVKDGVVYFIQNGGKAIQLPEKLEEKVELKELWTTQPKRERYYASPVIHDGLVYAVNQKGHFSAIDAKDGSIVYEQDLPQPKIVFPSIALAGNHLYVSYEDGQTVVIEPGRTYKQVAVNKMEGFRSTPVFQGKRMYLRTEKHLYCIGE